MVGHVWAPSLDKSTCFFRVKGSASKDSGMYVFLSEATFPAQSSGLVVSLVSILLAAAWLWYLVR